MNHSMSYTQHRKYQSSKYKLQRYLQYGMLIFAIVAVLLLAKQLDIDWNRLLFKEIHHVRVEGEYGRVDHYEIEKLLSRFIGKPISRDEMDVIERVLKDLPWVKNVLVKRSWQDDTLILTIQEREAIAYWGGQALLDNTGAVFRPHLIDNDNLPILDAATGRERDMLALYQQLTDWLAPIGLRVIHLKEDQSRTYTVQLENAPRLILGRHLFEKRIKRFTAAYQAGFVNYMHRVVCIDLRYLDGFAVRWKKDGESQSC